MGEVKMENKIVFTACGLAIDGVTFPSIELFRNIENDIYEFDSISYSVSCEIINNKMLWIYVKHGKAKPYAEEILNIDTKENKKNPRNPNEAELRNQIFYLYVPEELILYTSYFKKNKFLSEYLKDKFKNKFSIKNYTISPDEFVKEITSVSYLKFASANKNLFNGGIFGDVEDACGYGSAVNFSLEVKIKESIFDPGKCLSFLARCKKRKDNAEIDKMICIGEDDNGIEKIFNLETYLKKFNLKLKRINLVCIIRN
ncbi:hypothetical protein DMB95_06615 [Campylobacter sp. MIT 12-8780]|nr:hypothetical protein DMB95_06615 [Campylobacter sp. MIT 12-8780]